MVTTMTAKRVFGAAAVSRVLLLLWGLWQDEHMEVGYTDIDYAVFTDAARFVSKGQSPFLRSTYRYTPLLAYILLPNVLLHKAFGKILFAAADLLTARLLQLLLERTHVHDKTQTLAVCFWLFSPFTVTISTRGNGEAVVAFIILLMLLCIYNGRPMVAGLLYGAAVHWRIYPVIYGLPIVRYLAFQPLAKKHSYFNKDVLLFIIAAAGTNAMAVGTFYWLYGWEFLNHAYLYHATRVDVRHNFSAFFYPAYLSASNLSGLGYCSRAYTAAQAFALFSVGWMGGKSLPVSMSILTCIFVALNKVCTAQYFVWYFALLPLVASDALRTVVNSYVLLAAAAFWCGALANWLFWAYLLEFKGFPAHFQVWLSSWGFVVAQIDQKKPEAGIFLLNTSFWFVIILYSLAALLESKLSPFLVSL